MAASQVCRCVSTNPGMTIRPVASITSASTSAPRSASTALILSSSIRTSPVARFPIEGSMVRTVPPRMTVFVAMCPYSLLVRHRLAYSFDHLVDGGHDDVFQRVGERERHTLGRDPAHRRVQQLESLV